MAECSTEWLSHLTNLGPKSPQQEAPSVVSPTVTTTAEVSIGFFQRVINLFRRSPTRSLEGRVSATPSPRSAVSSSNILARLFHRIFGRKETSTIDSNASTVTSANQERIHPVRLQFLNEYEDNYKKACIEMNKLREAIKKLPSSTGKTNLQLSYNYLLNDLLQSKKDKSTNWKIYDYKFNELASRVGLQTALKPVDQGNHQVSSSSLHTQAQALGHLDTEEADITPAPAKTAPVPRTRVPDGPYDDTPHPSSNKLFFTSSSTHPQATSTLTDAKAAESIESDDDGKFFDALEPPEEDDDLFEDASDVLKSDLSNKAEPAQIDSGNNSHEGTGDVPPRRASASSSESNLGGSVKEATVDSDKASASDVSNVELAEIDDARQAVLQNYKQLKMTITAAFSKDFRLGQLLTAKLFPHEDQVIDVTFIERTNNSSRFPIFDFTITLRSPCTVTVPSVGEGGFKQIEGQSLKISQVLKGSINTNDSTITLDKGALTGEKVFTKEDISKLSWLQKMALGVKEGSSLPIYFTQFKSDVIHNVQTITLEMITKVRGIEKTLPTLPWTSTQFAATFDNTVWTA